MPQYIELRQFKIRISLLVILMKSCGYISVVKKELVNAL